MRMRNEQGVTLVEVLLVIIVLALVVGVGAYIYDVNRGSDSGVTTTNEVINKQVALTSFTDSSNLFTLKYPSSWKFSYGLTGNDSGVEPDWNKDTRPFSIKSPDSPKDSNGVDVLALNKADVSDTVARAKTDKNHTVTSLKIDGRDANYDVLVFTGPAAAEKYTRHTYYIYDADKVIELRFEESYYHNNVKPQMDWNDSKNLPAFQDIARSVTFLTSN